MLNNNTQNYLSGLFKKCYQLTIHLQQILSLSLSLSLSPSLSLDIYIYRERERERIYDWITYKGWYTINLNSTKQSVCLSVCLCLSLSLSGLCTYWNQWKVLMYEKRIGPSRGSEWMSLTINGNHQVAILLQDMNNCKEFKLPNSETKI